MRGAQWTIVLAAALAAAACGGLDEREWMKINEKYTAAEFQRDHAACSKSGKLDEACMRSRGWVAVSASKPGGKKEPEMYKPPGGFIK